RPRESTIPQTTAGPCRRDARTGPGAVGSARGADGATRGGGHTMRRRWTNLLFVVVIALAIGGGAYLLTTSMPSGQATTEEAAGSGGNAPEPTASQQGEGDDSAMTAPTPAAYDSKL